MAAEPTREKLHTLVDALPERDLADVEQLLERLANADPALRTALLAPLDDEALSEDEIAAIGRAKQEIAHGEYVTDEELDDLLSQFSK
jgi:predicted transcriptional regulator